MPAGKMGITRAANAISMAIERLAPANVVILGIAGSMTKDLEPGDVFVPDSVKEYLANAAATGKAKSWKFQTSGNELQTCPVLLNRFQFFEQTHANYYAQWRSDVAALRAKALNKRIERALISSGLALGGNAIYTRVTTSNSPAAPPSVKQKPLWNGSRTSTENSGLWKMESSGGYDVASIRNPAPRVIALRGISDFADARKRKFESVSKNRFRESPQKALCRC